MAGYAVSFTAVGLHIGDVITSAPRFHYAAILLVTIGFGVLTTISVVQEALTGPKDGSSPRLAGAMVLFLFAISFVHFETAHEMRAWSGEAALHHAGIPLALFVLLQDYRFLLLDAFIRFLVNGMLAALAVWLAFQAEARFALLSHARQNSFSAGLIFTAACLALSVFAYVRTRGQRFLTRVVFLRSNPDHAISELRDIAANIGAERDYLAAAGSIIARFLSSRRFELIPFTAQAAGPELAIAVLVPAAWNLDHWVQAIAPIRLSRGDAWLLALGARSGGRRYLSEDIEVLERLSIIVCEQIERIRNSEMQALVSQAELRALQAQINPHFLFNALNTLYGTISRENSAARHLVLNLAGLFRYSFAQNPGLIPIAEELVIVRAYLEIEELRLSAKLTSQIEADEDVLQARVPVLSIQPLVENAIKHGVALRQAPGFVRIRIKREPDAVSKADSISIEISNSGFFRERPPGSETNGVGLENVRRRLALCYGNERNLEISSSEGITTVRFRIPAPRLDVPLMKASAAR